MDEYEKQEIALTARAEKFRSKAEADLGIIPKLVDVYSDGTRMSGTLWKPKNAGGAKLPAILLCHGFGGKRAHLDYSYAPKFAQQGFIVLTFDYRGWGDSDGVLVSIGKQPKPDPATGLVSVNAKPVRRIVDPEWQLRDADSALNFLLSEPDVDTSRVGVWGSSYGGGHALVLATRDNRVACVVSQIGSINTHANWVNRHPQYRGVAAIHDLAAKHARGQVNVWDISKPHGLDGMPNLPKTVFEHTRNTLQAAREIQVPVMILAAENEELFMNSKNSELVYNMMKDRVPAELDYLPGKHYDAYGGESYKKGVKRALDWFTVYLGSKEMLESNSKL